jgi:hypothetical protein
MTTRATAEGTAKAPSCPAKRVSGPDGPKTPSELGGRLKRNPGGKGQHARSRSRQQPAVEPKPYRGDAVHFEVSARDYDWHTGQGRRFYAGNPGAELTSLVAVQIAIAEGAEVWSR